MVELWNGLVGGLGQLLAFFYDIFPNYGVAIILLTVAVRIALLPLALKQLKFQEEMKKKAPLFEKFRIEGKKLQEKYGHDRTRYGEEMLKLQKELGVNPLGQMAGCLPMLLQSPIMFAVYRVLTACGRTIKRAGRDACAPGFLGTLHLPAGSALRGAIITGQAGFLTMNLGAVPMAVLRGEGILASFPYLLLVGVMAVSYWVTMKQTMPPPSQDPQAQMMARITKIMPIMFVFWSLTSFPIGLTLYWTAFNVWMIGQQWVFNKIRAKRAEADASPKPAKPLAAESTITTKKAAPQPEQTPSPNGAGTRPQRPKGSGARKRRKRKR